MEIKVTLSLVVEWKKDGGEYFINSAGLKNGPDLLNHLPQDIIQFIMENLKNDYAGTGKQSGTDEFDVDDIKVEVNYKYLKGTPDKFSHSHGNWLPGDSDDIDIKSILLGEIDVSDGISDSDMDKIHDKILDNEGVNESKRHKTAIEKVEKRLESKLRRGKIKSKLVKKDSKIPGFSYWFQK